MNHWAFLILGILVLAFNLFGVGGPILVSKLRGKHSSPACIPFVGPIVLTSWAMSTHEPWWVIPLVWIFDAGTVLTLISIPHLFYVEWQTSSFTQTLALEGKSGTTRATLTIHSTGRFHLEMYRQPMSGQRGFVRAGQLGNVSETNGGYLLKPDYGGSRKLQPMPDGSFQVVEEEMPDHSRSFVIANWTFQRSP